MGSFVLLLEASPELQAVEVSQEDCLLSSVQKPPMGCRESLEMFWLTEGFQMSICGSYETREMTLSCLDLQRQLSVLIREFRGVRRRWRCDATRRKTTLRVHS